MLAAMINTDCNDLIWSSVGESDEGKITGRDNTKSEIKKTKGGCFQPDAWIRALLLIVMMGTLAELMAHLMKACEEGIVTRIAVDEAGDLISRFQVFPQAIISGVEQLLPQWATKSIGWLAGTMFALFLLTGRLLRLVLLRSIAAVSVILAGSVLVDMLKTVVLTWMVLAVKSLAPDHRPVVFSTLGWGLEGLSLGFLTAAVVLLVFHVLAHFRR